MPYTNSGMTPGGNYGDYYRGDYYRGDYYRGDPGIFGFLGGVVKKVAGVATSLLPGPIGAVARTVLSGATRARAPGMALAPIGPDYGPPGPGLPARIPGMPPPVLVGGGVSGVPLRPQLGGACPTGGHLNRSAYVTRGGGTSRWPAGQLLLHPKGTECVSSRRMNVGNARALRRSLTRLRGFERLARSVIATSRKFKKKGVRRRK